MAMIMKPETKTVLENNTSWLFLSLFFFVIGIGIAYFAPQNGTLFLEEIPATQQNLLQEMAQAVFEGPPVRGMLILFVNNMIASLQVMILGILLGVPTLLGLLANGALIGYVMKGLALEGIPLLTFISLGVLPHGIFELPAFFLSTSFGLKLGFHLVFPLPNKKRGQSLKSIFKEYWSILPLVVYLLLLAAAIEVLITPALLRMVIDF